jgi:phosphoglycolate phosphatase
MGTSNAETTLIFDWDGTLHNTKHLYGCAFRKAYHWLVESGYAPSHDYSDEDVSIYLGMNAPDMWNAFLPHLPQEIKMYCSDLVGREMVAAVRRRDAILYPGATETLTNLKALGYRMAILSNCKHAYLEAHRACFGLDQWFDGFYCCQDYDFAPKEVIFTDIRSAFPGRFLVIGDRASDLAVARIHHLPSIGCAYGFGTSEELADASAIANDVRELPEKIALVLSNPTQK